MRQKALYIKHFPHTRQPSGNGKKGLSTRGVFSGPFFPTNDTSEVIKIAGTKLSQKMRFLPYFPYGLCSRLATTIEGMDNTYATQLLLGENPDETVRTCERHRKNILDRAKYLCDKKFAKDSTRACGTPAISRQFRYITKRGLTVLIEAPDNAAADDPDMVGAQENLQGDHFRSTAMTAEDLRDILYNCAISEHPADQQTFQDTLLRAVKDGRVTPLTAAIALAENAKPNTTKYGQNQQLAIWRQSHIMAMMHANGHLTYMDRRPYDTGFAIDGITDEASYHAYISKHGHTIAAITYRALTDWYGNNPDWYLFKQRIPASSEEAKEVWRNTPAYYSALELPIAPETTMTTTGAKPKGSQRLNFTVHSGLATGRKVNYVCYHGKTGKFRWIPRREKNTKAKIEDAIHRMRTQCPDIPYRSTADAAIIFCSSHHQFLAIFDPIKEGHKQNKKQDYITDTPYTSIHCVPVNDSGTFLLWLLLEYSPVDTEQMIHDELVDMDIGFEHTAKFIYQLTYQGKRVLSGYSMNIKRISSALEDYLDGHDFYICCFPEQATWYKLLFPKCTIL